MAAQSVANQLETLADTRADIACAIARHQRARDKLLKPLKKKLEAIDKAAAEELHSLVALQAAQEAEVKSATIAGGTSVKSARLHAVLSPGKAQWDDSRLQGLAASLPAILDARTVGNPSVAIRKVEAAKQ
jgi:hypothetical protein